MRGAARSAIAVLGVVAALLTMPQIAAAHAMLKSSAPAADSTLAILPREVRLQFTESIALAFSRIELFGPDGKTIQLGEVSFSAESQRTIVAAIDGLLAAGTYTVAWQVAGDDGHPVRGRYVFTVAPGAVAAAGSGSSVREEALGNANAPSGQTAGARSQQAPAVMPEAVTFDAESPLYVAIRVLLFAGLLATVGAVAFKTVVLKFLSRRESARPTMVRWIIPSASHGAARVGLAGVLIVGVAAALRLTAQSYAMSGSGSAFDVSFIANMLTSTVWGYGWLLQVIAVALAVVGFRAAITGSRGWLLAGISVIALAFTPALSGHAASAPQLTALAVLADGFHIIGAGGWIGSLLIVVTVGIPLAMRREPEEREPAVAALINAFSPTALTFAGLAAATGVFAAWLHLGAVPALWQTTYGKTLLLKLGILSLVAATGAYNWLRVKPTLGVGSSAQRIRKSARAELGIAAFVIVVTAVLVATPTAMDANAMKSMSVTARGSAP